VTEEAELYIYILFFGEEIAKKGSLDATGSGRVRGR